MSAQTSEDYFELFGLPRSFVVDRAQLDARYRDLQRGAHPDRYANASEQERRISVQRAADINQAYQSLKDPMARGRYLLELQGVELNAELVTTRDPGFLMQQMELREAIGEVRNSRDPFDGVAGLMQQVQGFFARLCDDLETHFKHGAAQDTAAAVETVMKMKFYRRLEEELENLQADLEDELTN